MAKVKDAVSQHFIENAPKKKKTPFVGIIRAV
jgi:hypothetical protein